MGGGYAMEENNDNNRSDGRQQVLFVTIAVGEKVRESDGTRGVRIHADAAGNDQPVEIGADGKTDCRPCGVRNAGGIGDARQTHQQPAAHIGRLGAHCGDNRAELASAQIKVVNVAVALGTGVSDVKHHSQIEHNGNDDTDGG